MRNFHRGYKNDSSSSFNRGDRKTDRDSRYHQQGDSYKRPANKVKLFNSVSLITLNAFCQFFVTLRDSIEVFLIEILNQDGTMMLINLREALMDR